MSEKHIVTLDNTERDTIERMLTKGKSAARRLKRANILRLAHLNYTDEEIKVAVPTSIASIERTRAKFVLGGLEWALAEEPRTGAPAKLDGKQEAFLVALACTTPPSGRECWTMQLLADRLLQLQIIEHPISDETVRRALKKTNSSRGCIRSGVFPKLVLNLCGGWKMSWTSTPSRIIRAFPWSALMNAPIN